VKLATDLQDERCVPHYFCKNPELIMWERDDTSAVSLNNWIKKYDMACSDLIPYFGSAMFLGWMFASLVLPS